MEFQDYIKSELLVLIPVIYFIGSVLKKSKLADKNIPVTLGAISIALSGIWVFASTDVVNAREVAMAIFVSLTQGILIAGASVYANQIYVQAKKDE